MHQLSLREKPGESHPEVQGSGPTPTSYGEVSLHAPFSNYNQQINRDTASGNHKPTSGTIESREGPRTSVTPPNDLPTAHFAPSSSYWFGANPVDTDLSISLQEPAILLGQTSWRYESDPAPGRGRSRLPVGMFEDRYHSFSPSTANRRYGVIDIADFDNGSSGRRCSMATLGTEEQHDEATTDTDRRSHPDSMVIQMKPKPVQQDQIARDAPALPPDIELAAFNDDHYASSFVDADLSEVPKWGNIQNEVVQINKDVPPVGKWRCCECQRGHDIYRFDTGERLVSILSCLCKHRSCRGCTFHGNVRRFAPIDDVSGVASVPVARENGRNNRFGVVCRTCGLSWRAETVKTPKRGDYLRQRLSILPKKVNPLHKLRHTRSMVHLGLSREHHAYESRPGTALSTSRSVFNLRSASDSQAKGTKPEEQAQGAEVRFYGIECICSTVTDSRSLCFQVVDVPEVGDAVVSRKKMRVEAAEAAGPKPTSDLRAKGHDRPMLHMKGGSHPNPLFSNPVLESGP